MLPNRINKGKTMKLGRICHEALLAGAFSRWQTS
jgi:hypothetical protein